MEKSIVAIGEILWDKFPDGQKAGGSSMNVALNLHKQGINSLFISAIGDDENGRQLIKFLDSQNFPTALIQISTLPTSTVQVTLDEHQQASYTIVAPVAWDEIELTAQALSAVKNADALVYCSLTCRHEKSRNTIFTLLEQARLKVFDINLRPPFYNVGTLIKLLNKADILKVNEHELHYLRENFKLLGSSDKQLLKSLANTFNIPLICLTLGEKGAVVWCKDKFYRHQGYTVKVADTVGAGDSFLATFIASYLNGYSIAETLDRACKVGAFVASQKGANPVYGSEVFK